MPTRAPTGLNGSSTARRHDASSGGSSSGSLPAQVKAFLQCFRSDDHPSIVIKISSAGEIIERENFLFRLEKGPRFRVDLVAGDTSDKPGCEWIQDGLMYWLETSPNNLHIEANGQKGEAMVVYDGLMHIQDPTMGTMEWRAVKESEIAAAPKKKHQLTPISGEAKYERENKLIFIDKLQIMRWFQAHSAKTATGRGVTKVDVMRVWFRVRESRGGQTLQDIDQGFNLEDLLKDDYFAWDMFDGVAQEDPEEAFDTNGVQGYMRESFSRLDWKELWELCGNGMVRNGMYKNRWCQAVRFATSQGCQRRRAAARNGQRKLYTDLEADDDSEVAQIYQRIMTQSEADHNDSESENEAENLAAAAEAAAAAVAEAAIGDVQSEHLNDLIRQATAAIAEARIGDVQSEHLNYLTTSRHQSALGSQQNQVIPNSPLSGGSATVSGAREPVATLRSPAPKARQGLRSSAMQHQRHQVEAKSAARGGYAAKSSSPRERAGQGHSVTGSCCVCLLAPSEFAFLHADATAHLALCSDCHLEAGLDSCYICRQPATAIIRVHIS